MILADRIDYAVIRLKRLPEYLAMYPELRRIKRLHLRRFKEDNQLGWPDRPSCHNNEPTISSWSHKKDTYWRSPLWSDLGGEFERGEFQWWRTCSYCGSMHPADLLYALETWPNNISLESADMKYGWPHKYYVGRIPNPLKGLTVVSSCSSYRDTLGRDRRTPNAGLSAEYGHAKFYNIHLSDEMSNTVLLNRLLKHISCRGRVRWGFDPQKGVGYQII